MKSLFTGRAFGVTSSCDGHEWLNKFIVPKNEQWKRATGLWLKFGSAHFLEFKGETHGLPDSRVLGANKNTTVPLMTITTDLLDLIFISLQPYQNIQHLCLSPHLFYPAVHVEWISHCLDKILCLLMTLLIAVRFKLSLKLACQTPLINVIHSTCTEHTMVSVFMFYYGFTFIFQRLYRFIIRATFNIASGWNKG